MKTCGHGVRNLGLVSEILNLQYLGLPYSLFFSQINNQQKMKGKKYRQKQEHWKIQGYRFRDAKIIATCITKKSGAKNESIQLKIPNICD